VTKRPSSVCFLVTRIELGGAQTQILALAKVLIHRGWQVSVVSMRRPSALVDQFADLGVSVHSLDMPRRIPDPRALIRLTRFLRATKPDVLHCHMYHANILGRVTRMFVRIPVVVSNAHNIYEGGLFRELMYRLTNRLSDVTTNVCKAAVDRYVKRHIVPKGKIRLVYNGIDTARFTQGTVSSARAREELGLGGEFVWLAIGALSERKDYGNLLNAFPKVLESDPTAKLLIVGGGELGEQLESLSSNLGLLNEVIFVGEDTDVLKYLRVADGYVMSSGWEGFPMVLLEASAMALPAVCTDVGGNSEIIQHDRSGFLVEPRNSNLLSLEMRKIMEMTSSERGTMGEVGRRYVEKNFEISTIVSSWEDLYCEYFVKNGYAADIRP
jgi:glycosyltransferase involved in cell wall biosynthesis